MLPVEEEINDRFDHAAVHIDCDSDGDPVVTVVLSNQPGCGVDGLPPDHAIVVLSANDALQFPIAAPALYRLMPQAAMGGVYVDAEGEPHIIVAGRIEFDVFDPAARAAGSFAFLTAGAGRVDGQYTAEVCPHDGVAPGEVPACYPDPPIVPDPEMEEPDPEMEEPDPEVEEPDPEMEEPDPEMEDDPPAMVCDGDYRVSEWVFDPDQSAVPPRIINDLLAADIAGGALLLDAHIDADAETLQFVDLVEDAAGDLVPDPLVPESPVVDLNMHGRSFSFVEPSQLHVYLSAADYPGAQPLVFSMFGVELVGRFNGDCSRFSGHLRGAFVNDGYTIPQPMNADVDGDGVPDGWLMVGQITAEQL
jgi:hypothetical protein